MPVVIGCGTVHPRVTATLSGGYNSRKTGAKHGGFLPASRVDARTRARPENFGAYQHIPQDPSALQIAGNQQAMKPQRASGGTFCKGASGNPAGRRKGTPNKITERVRETLHAALDGASTDVAGWMRRLGREDPKAALQAYATLAEFVIPKLSRSEVEVERHEGGSTVLLPAYLMPDPEDPDV